MKDMETCVKHKVPIIITSLRPPIEIVEAAHSYGGVVFHDVINVKHARKAAEQGVDGLILVCAGAGGHAGTLSPFALLREVKQWFKGTDPAVGRDLRRLGHRVRARARRRHGLHGHALHRHRGSQRRSGLQGRADRARRRTTSSIPTCSPACTAIISAPRSWPRASIPTICRSSDKSKMNFGSGGNTKAKAWRDIWGSGQGIGQIADAPPVAELVERLKAEFAEASGDFLKRARA